MKEESRTLNDTSRRHSRRIASIKSELSRSRSNERSAVSSLERILNNSEIGHKAKELLSKKQKTVQFSSDQ